MSKLEDVARLAADARETRRRDRAAIRQRNEAIWAAKDSRESRQDIAAAAGLGVETIDRICRERPIPE